jgi:IS30 family transposase
VPYFTLLTNAAAIQKSTNNFKKCSVPLNHAPKGTDFNLISDEEILRIQNNLNMRPRKTLNFKRPVYVFVDMWEKAANQPDFIASVA